MNVPAPFDAEAHPGWRLEHSSTVGRGDRTAAIKVFLENGGTFDAGLLALTVQLSKHPIDLRSVLRCQFVSRISQSRASDNAFALQDVLSSG